MTSDEQLQLWVDGKPVHNDEKNECCPDFSCCRDDGKGMADEATRRAFYEAHRAGREDVTMGMLMMFLSGSFPSVHVAGFDYD